MSRMTPLVQAFVEQGRVADCPVIDLHTHPDRFSGIYFPDPEPEGILRSMDRAGVTTIAIAPHAGLVMPVDGNALSLRMIAAHPERFLAYWCINPHYPEELTAGMVHTRQTPGVIGFKVHPSMHNCALTDDAYAPVFAWAHEHRLLVLSHTWNDPRCGAAACREIATRYPDMVFLLGHSIWGDADGAIALAKEFRNVYLELTAAEHVPGFLEQAVAGAGTEKIVFGTDLPWFNPHFSLGCVLFADIDDDARHAILHGNAERILAEHAAARKATV
jgi:predicted TIM-barrel fold metal-dependent hydrolase